MTILTAPSSWKLFSSNDNTHWVEIFQKTKTDWEANKPVRTELALIGTNANVTLGYFTCRGKVSIGGYLWGVLTINSSFLLRGQIVGVLKSNLANTNSRFTSKTPIALYGMLANSLESISWNSKTHTTIGGFLNGKLYVVEFYQPVSFKMSGIARTKIQGGLTRVLAPVFTSIRCATLMSFSGYFISSLKDVTGNAKGICKISGVFHSKLNYVTGIFSSGVMLLKITSKIPNITSSIKLRVPLIGWFHGITTSILTGQVILKTPLAVFVLWHQPLQPVKLNTRFLTNTVGILQSTLKVDVSTRTYAVQYVSIINKYLQTLSFQFWGHVGPPIRANLSTTASSLQSRFKLLTTNGIRLSAIPGKLHSHFELKVPVKIIGAFISNLPTLISKILIKNKKWVFSDQVSIPLHSIKSSIKGYTWLGIKLANADTQFIEIKSDFKLVTPIPINGLWRSFDFYLISNIKINVLVYGKSVNQLKPVTGLFKTYHYCATMRLEQESPTARFRLKTPVRVIGTLNNIVSRESTGFIITSSAIYAQSRVVFSIQSKINSNQLWGQFRLHTIIVQSLKYGLLKYTLQDSFGLIKLHNSTISLRLFATLDSTVFKSRALYLIRANLRVKLADLNSAVTLYAPHFTGRLNASTAPPKGTGKGYTKIYAQVRLLLKSFTLFTIISKAEHTRAYLLLDIGAYQTSYIQAYNGGIFSNIAFNHIRIIHGQLNSTLDGLYLSTIKGIVPRRIYGRINQELNPSFFRMVGWMPIMGFLRSWFAPNGFKSCDILGQTTCGILQGYFSLNPYKTEIHGITILSTKGILVSELLSERVRYLNDYVYPLRSQIKGRVKIYGFLFSVLKGINYIYIRTENKIIGQFLGGDVGPSDSGIDSPMISELQTRIGTYINRNDKKHWTLRWVKSEIRLFHKFPIVGKLNSYLGNKPSYYIYAADRAPHESPMRMDMFLRMAIYFTFDAEVISFVEFGTGMLIYAAQTSLMIKAILSIKAKGVVSRIELNTKIVVQGRLASDLKHVRGEMGGFITIHGRLVYQLNNILPFIGIKVAEKYKVTLKLITETPQTRFNLYTPYTIYGVLINRYLSDLMVFSNWNMLIPFRAKLLPVLSDVKSTIYGKMFNVVGQLQPIGKLDRIYMKFILQTPLKEDNPGFISCYFISALAPLSVKGNFKFLAKIHANFDFRTDQPKSTIKLLTPIRIWGYSFNYLEPITAKFTLIAYPTARPNWKLEPLTGVFNQIFYAPIQIFLTGTLNNDTSLITGISLIEGRMSISNLLVIGFFKTLYGRFFTMESELKPVFSQIHATFYIKSTHLPYENNLQLGGKVENKHTVDRTYHMQLLDYFTGELLKTELKLPPNPFKYQFSKIIKGKRIVLAKPLQQAVGSQAKVIEVSHVPDESFEWRKT